MGGGDLVDDVLVEFLPLEPSVAVDVDIEEQLDYAVDDVDFLLRRVGEDSEEQPNETVEFEASLVGLELLLEHLHFVLVQ